VDVQDSDASGSDILQRPIDPLNSVDSGNTIDWFPFALPTLVYGENGAVPAEPRYRTWDWIDMSNEGTAEVAADQTKWVVLKASPLSEEMILAVFSSADKNLYVQTWDGTKWALNWDTSSLPDGDLNYDGSYRMFDVAYERNSGDAVVVYGDRNDNTLRYRQRVNGTWGTPHELLMTPDNEVVWVKAESRPNSDDIFVGIVTTTKFAYGLRWDGSSDTWPVTDQFQTSTKLKSAAREAFDLAFESASGDAFLIWGDETRDVRYREFTTSWQPEPVDPAYDALPGDINWLAAAYDPLPTSSNIAIGMVMSNTTFEFGAWNGSSWVTPRPTAIDARRNDQRGIDVAFGKKTGEAIYVFNTDDDAVAASPEDERTMMSWRTWSSAGGFGPVSVESGEAADNLNFVQLKADPFSNDMMAVYADNSGALYHRYWDGFGSSWSALDTALETNLPDVNQKEPFMFAWNLNLTTAVNLLSLRATGQGDSVKVAWQTAQEINNMGFNLYRGTSPRGPFTKVNNELIPGLISSVKGKAYTYEDTNVSSGTLYYYKLEDIDLNRKRAWHGPVCVDWDGDGMADDWEIAHGLDPTVDDSMLDLDGDGLTNLEEYELGTDPLNPDTDGDGIPDGEESRKRDPGEITVGRTLTQGVQIIESDAEGITLELRTDSFEARTVQAEGQDFERLRITEYIHGLTDEVGKPELPMKGILLDIPQGNSATVTVIEIDDQVHSGYRVYPVPDKAVDEQAQLTHVGEIFVIDEAAYSVDSFYPEAVARLGEIYVFRGQQKQQILFSPLTFNPATGEIRHYRRIRVRLSYVAGGYAKAAGPEPTPWSPSVGDDGSAAFSSFVKMAFLTPSMIVNPIASVLSSAAILARVAWAPPPAAEPAYKILVVEEGIYRVTRSWLEDNWVDVAGIDLSQVRLYNLGEEVAIRVEDGGVAGQFDYGDFIEFYGTPVESQYAKYTSNNVYWLTTSGGFGTPKRMADVDASLGSATVSGSHSFTVHHEQDMWYLLSIPGGDSLDRWFFDPFVDGPGIAGGGAPVDFALTLPGVAGQGSVKISMVGFYDTDHAVDVSVNGSHVGSFSWGGISFYLATIDGVDLLEGDNTISLTCTSGEDSIAVDWFEVTYPRSFAAENESLKFSHEEGYRYQVTGFNDNDLGVFDITSAAEVERLINFPISGSGSYSLEFEPVASGAHSYLVLSASAVKTPVSITQDSPSSLADPANGADYILITHRDLGWDGSGDPLPWLSDLVTLRESQGLRVQVVDVEDIFDEFSYGVFAPQAVKDFLAHAYENWSGPAVQYVLLVGDSTYDPKGNYSWMMGADATTYLPTYLAATTYMGETVTDEWFARVSGDDAVPDLYIGRIPAASTAEAAVLVNKIITYENGLNSKGWERNVLLVADNRLDDYEAVFEQMNEDAASLLPAGMNAPFRGYLDDYLISGDLTAEIKGKIDEGTLMVNYSGHGSTQVWANEGIFEHGDPAFYRQDVADLTNGDKLPFLVGMSCLTGYFGYPESWSFPSLAETMLRSEDKGAVAAFMPTGMTPTEGQHVLNTALFESVFTEDLRTLGPAISAAKQTLLANGKSDYEEVSETFLLFGDPAMTLNVPLPTRPEGVVIEGNTSSLTVSWQEATDCDGNPVAGYNVYRSTSPGGSYEKVNDSLITGTQFADTPGLAGAASHAKAAGGSGTIYYVVTSVDSDGDESVYSEEKSVTAGGDSSSGGGGGGGCFINTLAGK
jgi:hypothetical protein